MESLLITAALILSALGIAGCLIPALPGPPINYIALLLMQWAIEPFRLRTLILWAIISILVVTMDYLIPIFTAKKFGATKQGIRGSILGMFFGMFLTPVGMIAGLIIGSIIGDLLARQSLAQATRSAAGSLFGTIISIGFKLCCSGWMTLLVVYKTIQYYST